MKRSAAGAMAWSPVGMTAYFGSAAGAVRSTGSVKTEAATGRWAATKAAAWRAGMSAAKTARALSGLIARSTPRVGDHGGRVRTELAARELRVKRTGVDVVVSVK